MAKRSKLNRCHRDFVMILTICFERSPFSIVNRVVVHLVEFSSHTPVHANCEVSVDNVYATRHMVVSFDVYGFTIHYNI